MKPRYRRNHIAALAGLLLIWLASSVLTIAPAQATEEPRFNVDEDRLQRLTPEGEVAWEIRHASVWSDKRMEERSSEILGPVQIEQGWFYTASAHLFEFDPNTGTILERHPMPGQVTSLERAGDDTLRLDVATIGGELSAEISYLPGSTPPIYQTWDELVRIYTWKDATFLHPKAGATLNPDPENPIEVSESEHREVIEVLDAVKSQEPGNPFYDLFAAVHLGELGESEQADVRFRAAAARENGSWASDFMLVSMLEAARRPELAKTVWERTDQKVSDQYPELRQQSSLVPLMVYYGIFGRDPLTEAVNEGDVATVDRIHRGLLRLMPRAESSSLSRRALIHWLDENGRDQLASQWRDRVVEAPADTHTIYTLSRELDLLAVWLLALLVALPFAAWFVGVHARSGRWSRWLPVPRVVDLISIGILMLAAVIGYQRFETTVNVVGHVASAPIACEIHAWGSPEVVAYLEELHPSPERDELLDYARSVAAAFEQGIARPQRGNTADLLAAARRVHAAESDIAKGLNVPAVPEVEGWQLIPLIVFLVLLVFVGHALSQAMPRLTRATTFLIPGGARHAGPLGGAVGAAVFAGALSLLSPADQIFSQFSYPGFAKYLGFVDHWPRTEFFISETWAWIVLSVAVVLHIATVLLDRRSASESGQ